MLSLRPKVQATTDIMGKHMSDPAQLAAIQLNRTSSSGESHVWVIMYARSPCNCNLQSRNKKCGVLMESLEAVRTAAAARYGFGSG
jgi:hypothetical protein